MHKHYAQLAQLVEQGTENPCVSGSIPELGIYSLKEYGILAQSVEHLTFNQVVRGSNPRCLIVGCSSEHLKTSEKRIEWLLFASEKL